MLLLIPCDFVVEKPELQPRKDYDDYTKFINDTYTEEKENMLAKTVSCYNRNGGFNSASRTNPLHTLRTYSERPGGFMNKRNIKGGGRNFSVSGNSETEKLMGQTFVDFNVKPKILESKISQ